MAGKKPLKNKRNNKTVDNKCCGNFADLGHEITTLIKHAKDQYEGLDEQKKKALIAGAAGAIALIAGAIGYKKRGKK